MPLARKLFLLAAMALTAMAMAASTASAQSLEVHSEESPEPEVPCGIVTLMTDHVVEGGCHVEFISTEHIPLVAYIPAPTVLTVCDVHLKAMIGEDGEGYVTEADLTNEDPIANPPCQRQACDESETGPTPHAQLPWPIHIREAAGVESIEARFCLRTGTPPPENSANEGAAQTRCTVHLPVADLGGHSYEIGAHPSEFQCEPGDFPFPVSIRNAHFTNEIDPEFTHEDIEIIH